MPDPQQTRVASLLRIDLNGVPPARLLCEALAGRSYEVHAVHVPDTAVAETYPAAVVRHDLPLRRTNPSPWAAGLAELRWAASAVKALIRIRPSLIIASNPQTLPWALIASRMRRVPVVYCAYEYVSKLERRAQSPLNRLYLRLETRLARRASIVCCPEPTRAERMTDELGLSHRPMVVRNTTWIRDPVARPGRIRVRLPVLAESLVDVVLYQGGISDAVEFEALIRSVAKWPSDAHLVFVGWATSAVQARLENVAAESDITDRVHFAGEVPYDELWDVLTDADAALILYAERTENERLAAPNKLGEYLMAGLPVVFTANLGISGAVGDHDFAYEVRLPTPDLFAEAVSAALRERNGASARRFALCNFNFESQAEPLLQAIEERVK